MKKQLLKNFYACLPVGMAFIVTAMMISATVNAQIVYTDVVPDTSMVCQPVNQTISKQYNLDLNNDSNNDFILSVYSFRQLGGPYAHSVWASPLNGNAVKDTLVDTANVSIPLHFNAVIDSNLLLQQSWQTSGTHKLMMITPSDSSGLWNALSDYYLGLRLVQSGQTYYGWVRSRVSLAPPGAAVTIRDYAYNSIPNQPILAGQTTATGIIENNFSSSINLFPNPVTNHLTIALGGNNKKVEVIIADITGKIIYTTTTDDPDSYRENKIEVNTSELEEGIYIVQIQSADFIRTKKLVVKK